MIRLTEDGSNGERAPFYGTLEPGWEFYRRPGARLTEEKHPDLVRSGEAVADVEHDAWHRFDKAHLVMLAEQGIVPTEIAAKNLRELRRMEADDHVRARRELGHLAHSGEAHLIRELGEETAGWIHVGRSSVDLSAVARRTLMREGLLDVMEATLDAVDAHCETASDYVDAPMPIITRSRHSQVGTFAYYLMAWARPLERGIDRLDAAYRSVNRSPAGSAAGTTTDFPIDRDRTADLLGFEGVEDNALDATMGDYDTVLDLLSVLTAIIGSVAVAADRLVTWGGTEYGLVDMPDRYYSTSSILTHKTNPRGLRTVQGTVDGTASELMKAYVGIGHESGHTAQPSASRFEDVVDGLELWSEIVRDLEFDAERGEELVYSEWALVPDVAGQLVREAGINWRWAHQIMAVAVRRAEAEGESIRDLDSEAIDDAAVEYLGEPLGVSQSVIDEAIDARRAIEARGHVTGSPAPEQVERQIEASRETIETGRARLETLRTALEEAESRLDRAVDDVVSRAGLDED